MVKYSNAPESLFAALAQPRRRKIVEHLVAEGPLSVSELAQPLSISLPATLKHVHVLAKSGLLTCQKKGRARVCTVNRRAFEQMVDWLESQKRFWDASFDRLEKQLTSNKESSL